MPVSNTPIASNTEASNALISTPPQSTTATTPQTDLTRKRMAPLSDKTLREGGSRKKVQIYIPLGQTRHPNLDELDNILDEIMKLAVESSVSKPGFKDEIIDFFAKKNKINSEQFQIEEFKGKGTNALGHFILTYKEKKWHAKPVLHGPGISCGTKFNEFAHYKLNESLGIGPRCYGFVSNEGVTMIFTEDLEFRSLGEEVKGKEFIKKKITFQDNTHFKNKCDTIPERHGENVNRCVIELVINLFQYKDVQNNLGNTGFKISDKKEKPFIVDFTLKDQNPLAIGKNEIEIYAKEFENILVDNKESSNKEFHKNIFAYKRDAEVIKGALKKLFLDDNGEIKKFENDIKKAFGEARELLKTRELKMDASLSEKHANALNTQEKQRLDIINTFLENEVIRTFLKEAGPQHKEEQLEKKKIKEKKFSQQEQETKSSPRTDVSPTNSTGQSIGSAGTDSPLPLYLFLAMIF